jgi:hypothetical protein
MSTAFPPANATRADIAAWQVVAAIVVYVRGAS